MKLLFIPISMMSGLIAGLLGKKLFEAVWGLFDDEEPPEPSQRDIDMRKMVAAVTVQGAVFALVRGIVEHQSRRGFAALTGSWPGEKRPDKA